jgi:hypothetical protein
MFSVPGWVLMRFATQTIQPSAYIHEFVCSCFLRACLPAHGCCSSTAPTLKPLCWYQSSASVLAVWTCSSACLMTSSPSHSHRLASSSLEPGAGAHAHTHTRISRVITVTWPQHRSSHTHVLAACNGVLAARLPRPWRNPHETRQGSGCHAFLATAQAAMMYECMLPWSLPRTTVASINQAGWAEVCH